MRDCRRGWIGTGDVDISKHNGHKTQPTALTACLMKNLTSEQATTIRRVLIVLWGVSPALVVLFVAPFVFMVLGLQGSQSKTFDVLAILVTFVGFPVILYSWSSHILRNERRVVVRALTAGLLTLAMLGANVAAVWLYVVAFLGH